MKVLLAEDEKKVSHFIRKADILQGYGGVQALQPSEF